MSEHLPREFQICDRPARSQIVQHHGLPVARGLREPHVTRDYRVEDLAREIAVHLVANLDRQARPAVEHREHDALDREARIQALASEVDGVEQMGVALKSVGLALERHEDTVGVRERLGYAQPEW